MNLTPEEKVLVENARIAKKIAELKKVRLEETQEKIRKFKTMQRERVNAYSNFFNKLQDICFDAFEYVCTPKTQSFVTTYFDKDTQKSIQIGEELVEFNDIKLVYKKDTSYYVTVKKHYTSDGTNNGFKMYMPNIDFKQQERAYKSAKTVVKKITEDIAQKNYEQAQKSERETLLSTARKIICERYEGLNSSITLEEEYVPKPYARPNEKGYYMRDFIKVVLNNGITVELYFSSFKEEITFSIKSIDSKEVDKLEILDALAII